MSCNKSSSLMNQLPNELLILIFERLKFRDLIQCSLVCKRFKLVCQSVTIPELIISNKTGNIKDFWFYTHKKFNLQDAITVATFNTYRSIFRLDKFRRLYFEGCQSEYAKLLVNDLTQLEQMKINVKSVVNVENDIHINLQNVKIVEISKSNHRFFITTPKLEILKCPEFDAIYLTHSNTIKYLETDFYSESFHVLKNLQFLLVENCSEFNWSDTLSAFPNLATFNCDSCDSSHGIVPRAIENLVEHKLKHQLSVPKIYFLSVELDDIKKIDEYNSHRDDFLFRMNNYNSLAETIFSNRCGLSVIYYDRLMDVMKGKIPKDFFQKFFYIQMVSAVRVENQEHLFDFLKSFDYLSELNLPPESLDQSFYNRLDAFDQLVKVTVEGAMMPVAPPIVNPNLNFDVFLRLKNLTYLSFDNEYHQLLDLTPKLFSRLKYFKSMDFVFSEEFVMIEKDVTTSEYRFRYCGYEKNQLDLTGLVCELDAIRNRRIKYSMFHPLHD